MQKFNCRHYSFNNGQHRICVAAKLGVNLNIPSKNINEQDNICQYCVREEIKKEKIWKTGKLGKNSIS